MSVKKRKFPPLRLAELEPDATSRILALTRSLRTGGTFAVFIGAGVSASAGVPDWKGLLHRITATFFTHWELDIKAGHADASQPPSFSIALWEEHFWTDAALRSAQMLKADDALLVAQQIRNCLDEHNWQYLLRKLIYGDDFGGYRSGTSPLISGIIDLVKCCAPAAIINYNYDDLLDQALKLSGGTFVPVWKHRSLPDAHHTAIFHPHGYLPLGGGPFTTVVIGENEYQQEATEAYSWSNLIQLQYLTSCTCLFIGHSLTDPNLRRLLRIASSVPTPRKRYAFLPFPTDPDQATIMRRTLFDKDLWRLEVTPIRFPAGLRSAPDYSLLPRLLHHIAAARSNFDHFWEGA